MYMCLQLTGLIKCARMSHTHDFDLREMLIERQGKATQHNRKTKQHNTTRPRQLFFKEKIAASGGTRTHDRPLARRRSYQLSYRGSSVGWA